MERKEAREQRIKYYTLMVYEDADATLLRLFECFMESAPQLILQVRYSTKDPSNPIIYFKSLDLYSDT